MTVVASSSVMLLKALKEARRSPCIIRLKLSARLVGFVLVFHRFKTNVNYPQMQHSVT